MRMRSQSLAFIICHNGKSNEYESELTHALVAFRIVSCNKEKKSAFLLRHQKALCSQWWISTSRRREAAVEIPSIYIHRKISVSTILVLVEHANPNHLSHHGCNISGRLVQSPAAGFCLYKSNWRLSLNGEPPWTSDSTCHCLPSCDRS
uniref:Uncharacterized protein n=1 Tax=Timema monikensis TaxID=170555 RepID=A0A7R9EF27_9NEOP|nr:unnamed protein product [Timema monikensis]